MGLLLSSEKGMGSVFCCKSRRCGCCYRRQLVQMPRFFLCVVLSVPGPVSLQMAVEWFLVSSNKFLSSLQTQPSHHQVSNSSLCELRVNDAIAAFRCLLARSLIDDRLGYLNEYRRSITRVPVLWTVSILQWCSFFSFSQLP